MNVGPNQGNLPSDDEDDLKEVLGQRRAQKRWVQEINFYEKKAVSWENKGKKILRRYKDERSPREIRNPRFNILWSNIQTLMPALYAKKPKPDIERRFRDKDDLGRVSSQVLERSVTYFTNEQFDQAMRQAVFDRLLPGRGTVWVRYEPHFKDAEVEGNDEIKDEGTQITDDVDTYGESESQEAAEPQQIVEDEVVCWDYVHWQDFGHTFGRTWEEVDAPWRKVYLTRKELVARFGEEIGEKITLDYAPEDLKDVKYDEVEKKATIYEIWCKSEKKVYWIHKSYEVGPLDVKDDPLGLTGFYPFPKPLYATLSNDDMMPVADYLEYQDQAHELDELTSRIGAITKCVKVAGVYDASAAGVERLLAEGVENQLVPVSQWAIFGEKGGLKGVMDLMPMEEILKTLLGLYEARGQVKQDLYEITGLSDIIRGASNPNETARAQEIKSQFGSMRLTSNQDDVARFARDLIKIGTEIIAEHFSLDTIKSICGMKLLTAQEKQMISMQQQMQQAAPSQRPTAQALNPATQTASGGVPPAPPPQMDEEMEELMLNPTWEEVDGLLRDDPARSYRIDIETDSTIKFDQQQDKEARIEFLQATSGFLEKALTVPPELAPLAGKMLEFGIRGFKVGKDLESAFEVAIRKLEKKAQNPQAEKPDPEMVKVQGEMQVKQQEMQMDQQKAAADAQLEQMKMQGEAALEKMKMEMEMRKDMAIAKLEAETQILVAQIQAKASLKSTALTTKANADKEMPNELRPVDAGDGDQGATIDQLMQTVIQRLEQAFGGVAQGHQALAQAIQKPKQVVRDPATGDIVGLQ